MGLYSPRPYQTQVPPSFAPSPYQPLPYQQHAPQPPIARTLWFVQFYWLFWLAVSFLISFAVSSAFWGGL